MLESTAGTAKLLIAAAKKLRRQVDVLDFGEAVEAVYNPLNYAWPCHEQYLQRYGQGPKRVLLVGMNPGPWGMAQTGVPFGEVRFVRDWLKIHAPIGTPAREHPKRPVQGFDCTRREISGQRLWGLFAERFGRPEAFFADHFVTNYCPLVFMEETGRNRTPDKLPRAERDALERACDAHLRAVVGALEPEHVIGIGRFAQRRIAVVVGDWQLKVGCILHPSPASPAGNRDWAGTVTRQLEEMGVW
jgi:single-strand selective monofunctional uracil DNA glycosylase